MNKKVLLLLLFCVSFQLTACAQNAGKSPANQTKPTEKTSTQSKEIELPANIKKSDYEGKPDESLLFLTVNSDGQVFCQDKPLDDSALKNLLTEYNEKHKDDPSTSGVKYPSMYEDKYKSFYLKADARASFSQILKVLKAVQESSQTSYRAKFIVNPQEKAGKAIETPNGRYVVKIDLGIKEKIDENAPPPRPNPLTLVVRLESDGKIKINNQPKERSEFPAFLGNIFKQREQNGVFREGTNEVEKNIILLSAPDAKYGDVIKFIDELYEIGANPIVLGDVLKGENSSGIGNGTGSGQGTGRGSGQGAGSKDSPVKKP